MSAETLWYKDAIIYQLHVRTFCDSNGDGVGDFKGLIGKLDYVQALGANAIWLLPFYESPLCDDGYDIAHYERVDPRYGRMRDFKEFLREAHRRNLYVFTELVINHTSDQHPWFQASRAARAGSLKRDFYVWSDTNQRYLGARVIFSDAEPSNWTWDPVAGAYYWHRFFRHQPDLNFDNPRVQKAVLKVMRFWLEMGVDGLRLDAIPHLYEREGTNCENLPETHAFLKRIRAEIDERYMNRVLLAELDQLPEDVRTYFADADECHMAFHFPFMTRLFLALKLERAAPVIAAIQRTDFLPVRCQWAVFLRNHDELTVSTFTADEREFMFERYAPEPRMRLNLGIRRRLAPLMENSRQRIELANALLLSMPGSPVIYYGDEIGMGDNISLPDRDGVRTPMQWNAGPNGGFSAASGALTLPVIDSPVYGYHTLNVEAQERDAESLLNHMRRLIQARRSHRAFGHGSIEFLDPGNPQVLACVRHYENETIVVAANLSTAPQSIDLHLPAEAAGRAVRDLVRDEACQSAGLEPYHLDLKALDYRWLSVLPAAS